MSSSSLSSFKESPLSWKIWFVLWVLPIFFILFAFFSTGQALNFAAMFPLVITGFLAYSMIFKPQWTRGFFIFIAILDFASWIFVIGIEQMTSYDVGNAFKEILFLLYLYFSSNALAYQDKFRHKNEKDSSDDAEFE